MRHGECSFLTKGARVCAVVDAGGAELSRLGLAFFFSEEILWGWGTLEWGEQEAAFDAG